MNTDQKNLDYLREVQDKLSYEQKHACDILLLGVLAVHVPEHVWQECVSTAIRLATTRNTAAPKP